MSRTAEAGEARPFEVELRVHFHQADPAGVLFFGRASELINTAYEHLVESHGLSWPEHFGPGAHATPIVRLETDYHRPIRAGERVRAIVRTAHVGRRSFALRYRLEGRGDAEDLRVAALVRYVYVHAREDGSFEPMPLPPPFRAALAAHAEPDAETEPGAEAAAERA